MIKLATVFSGVGAVEQALEIMKIEYEIIFACDNGEAKIEVDLEKIKQIDSNKLQNHIKTIYENNKKTNYVKKAYFRNYNIAEDKWHEDIRFINGYNYQNQVDLFVGGSPCQSFSIIGKRGGLEDHRGNLFNEYIRLVNEIKPKVFIFENVVGILSHDKGNTWEIMLEEFKKTKYKIYYDILNAKGFGIPQDRKRVFVIGFLNNGIDKFNFPKPIELTTTVKDYLEDEVDIKHYLGKKGFEFVTNLKYQNRARINKDIIQTQKANQQYNWNGDFVFEQLEELNNKDIVLTRAHVGEYNGKKGVIRQLSYRECFRLMGFPDKFIIDVPNVQAYRQAGNSIVVNVLQKIIEKIIETKVFDNEKN